jgi:hypothetical protein
MRKKFHNLNSFLDSAYEAMKDLNASVQANEIKKGNICTRTVAKKAQVQQFSGFCHEKSIRYERYRQLHRDIDERSKSMPNADPDTKYWP